MSSDLFERILIQLEPEVAREFGSAILEDKKKLEAFEIIKERRVDIPTLLMYDNAEEFNVWVSYRSHYPYPPHEITQEEYDLLTEVLHDQ